MIDGHSAEHGDDHVGGTGVVDEVAGRWVHRTCLSDLCVVLTSEDPPSDDGDQNNKQRCCFWWLMEAGEWGGITPPNFDLVWNLLVWACARLACKGDFGMFDDGLICGRRSTTQLPHRS